MSDSRKAAEKALEKLSDQLTCSVCLDTYRDPRVLPCLHVFCMTCLERLVSRDGTSLTCPNCRKTIQPPQGGVSQLPTAFYVNHLFDLRDTLEKVKDAKVNCQNCGENKATGYCRNCSEFYCQECISMHKKWKTSANHEIATVEEIQGEALNLVPATKKATLTCSKHPGEILKVYCETCDELICRDCTVKTHRDHEYDLVGDCFPKHQDAIVASLQPVKQQLDTVNQAVGEMDARARRLAEQTLSTKQRIQDEINRLHDALEIRKRELMANVDQIARQTEKMIQAQREGYELTQTQFSSCLEFVEESLRTGSQEEILSMKKQVVERVEQMAKDFDPAKFQPEPEQVTQFSHQQLSEACQGFGEVFNSPLCPEKSYATGKGMESARDGIPATLTLHTVNTREQAFTHPKAPVTGELVSRGDGGVVKCEVTGKEDNTYELKYQPRTRGEHDLHVKVYGRHIKDSPFTVTVGGFQGIHVKTIEQVKVPRNLITTANEDLKMVVIERDLNCIVVLDRDGRKVRSFGNVGTGDRKLVRPNGVALLSDNTVLVGDQHCVKKFTLEGKFITSVGSRGSGQLEFKTPYQLVYNPTNEKVYVCEQGNNRIQILNIDLTFSSMFGSTGSRPGQFDSPEDVCIDTAGNIYVADYGNNRVQIFSSTGQYLREIKQRVPEKSKLEDPISVCVDGQNYVYVVEHKFCRVSVFNSDGTLIKEFGQRGSKAGEFKGPMAITVDPAGQIYICDYSNGRIQIFI